MVNASWDIIIVFLIALFWVETRGKTLEEIDVLFDRTKHSSVPDVEAVRTGKEALDVGVVEKELENRAFERQASGAGREDGDGKGKT